MFFVFVFFVAFIFKVRTNLIFSFKKYDTFFGSNLIIFALISLNLSDFIGRLSAFCEVITRVVSVTVALMSS